jgi:hypothetical protein
MVDDASQKAANETQTSAAENVGDVVCQDSLDVGDVAFQEIEDDENGRSFRLNLPGRVAWVPEKQPGAG